MNRITAIMTAFLVLLLLASGFMAADNIRLSGERAAIVEELNRQNYDYALLTRQIENQQNALALLTQERDELLLQLQDYQPGVTPGADEAVAASPAPHSDKDVNAAGTPSSPLTSPGPVPAAPTVSPAANSGKSAEAASSPAPAYATKAPAFPDAVAVTEDFFPA